MDTIEDVFAYNLRRLRGTRTQAEMAELAEIPHVTYHRAEQGKIPQSNNLTAIARAFGVPETALFLDPDLVPKAPTPTPQQALEVLARAIEAPSPKLSPALEKLSRLSEEQLEQVIEDVQPEWWDEAEQAKKKA